MARTHTVQSARKAQGSCMSPDCRHESRAINVGDSYKWFAIRAYRGGRGTRKVYHVDCRIPQSHRTTSVQLGTIYDAQEACENDIAALNRDQDADAILDDLRSIAEALASGIREAGEMYAESAANIESGFGTSTYISQELEEKAETLESWASDIESIDFDEFYDESEEFDEPTVRGEVEIEVAREVFDIDEEDAREHQAAGTLLDAIMNAEGEHDFQEEVDRRVEQREQEHEAEQGDDQSKQDWIDEQVTKLEEEKDNFPL